MRSVSGRIRRGRGWGRLEDIALAYIRSDASGAALGNPHFMCLERYPEPLASELPLYVGRDIEDGAPALVAAAAEWAYGHNGTTLLIVPERAGSVPLLRNAHSFVLPPVQADHPLLHKVLPTLPGEIPLRHDQLRSGLATQLNQLAPTYFDLDVLKGDVDTS